ncbi:MAG: flippase [Planctomycetota bacterium]
MSTNNIVTRNFLAFGSGEVISRLIAFCTAIYLARILGAENYGIIAFAIGVTLYLSKIADFSIEVIGTKEIAKSPDSVNQLASSVISIRLVFAILLTGLSILAVQLFLKGPECIIISLYLVTLIPIAANTKWVHLGLENAWPVGLSRIVSEVLALGLVIIFVRNMNDLWGAPFAQIAGEFCFALILILLLKKQKYKFGFCWDLTRALPVFLSALPLLGQTMLFLIIYNSDLIFLRLFRDSESVGYYAAAYMLICFLANVGHTYGMSLLPTLTRLGAKSSEEKSLYHTAIVHMYTVCLPISIGGCILASQIIKIGYGENYTYSILALQVLIWCIPLSLLRIVPWAMLIARGHQKDFLKIMIYSVITNIALNTLLVPKYGMIGAAIATVITETLTGVLMFKCAAHHELPFVALRRFCRPTVACLFMTGVLIVFRQSNIFVNLISGVGTFGIVLTAIGGIRFRKGQLPALDI